MDENKVKELEKISKDYNNEYNHEYNELINKFEIRRNNYNQELTKFYILDLLVEKYADDEKISSIIKNMQFERHEKDVSRYTNEYEMTTEITYLYWIYFKDNENNTLMVHRNIDDWRHEKHSYRIKGENISIDERVFGSLEEKFKKNVEHLYYYIIDKK